MRIARARAHARAGLLGNPSDGYHGATLATTVRNFAAEVTVYEWPELEILPAAHDHCRFDEVDGLLRDIAMNGYEGGLRLVKAAIKRFCDHCAARGLELSARTFSIRYDSTIPRQVGLAGSSAIVCATLNALCAFHGVSIARELLPGLALTAETEELGLPAGLQDRVAQVYDGLVFMDFDRGYMAAHGHGRYEPLDAGGLPPLFVAYQQGWAEPSSVMHSDLRARFRRGDVQVVEGLGHLAGLARAGRDALVAGDGGRLADLVDEAFATRRRLHPIDPRDDAMVEAARAAGGAATLAGSGGAVAGVLPGEHARAGLERALTAQGCAVIRPIVT